MLNLKFNLNPLKQAGIILLLSAIILPAGLSKSFAVAEEYTGKVVAVFHEAVKNNDNKWYDKVSVTIDRCDAPGQLITGYYTPSATSDAQVQGFLFRDTLQAARHHITKNQYMNIVNGHVSLKLDETNPNTKLHKILKTTFWGYNWECGKNIGDSASGKASAGAGGSAGINAGAGASTNTRRKIPAPGFGIVNPLGL